MSEDSLVAGLEAGGGVLPGPPGGRGPPAPRQGLHGGDSSMLQTPVCDLRTPSTPKAALELLASNGSSSNSNGGAPTLTTPTLTPTTLRNIEQMFAESDPQHGPPAHYEHAAGFAPPIISPTSGNSYVPLGAAGQTAPLNCHRPPSPPRPTGRPGPPPDLCPLPTKPPRPTNLCLSRPPPLLEAPTRHRPACLLPPQQQPADLSLPSPTRGDLSISLVKPEYKQQLPALERTQPPAGLPLSGANLLSRKLDMMDKLLKAVAASASMSLPPKQEPDQPPSPPPYRDPEEDNRDYGLEPGAGGRQGPEEEGRRAQRRERNKQAAARCRKRRMDLTETLQGEVEQWEEKVRGQKEELLGLEAQKKGLEAVLRRHQGPCKVAKD